MKTNTLLCVVAVLCLMIAGVWGENKPATKPAAPHEVAEASKGAPSVKDPPLVTDMAAIRQSAFFTKDLPRMSFQGMKLGDIIAFCRDESGQDVVVDWPRLKEYLGVDETTPCTITLTRKSPGALLDVLLNAIRTTKDNAPVFQLRYEVIFITADVDAETKAVQTEKARNEVTAQKIQVLGSLKESYQDPLTAALLALGSLRDCFADNQAYGQHVKLLLEKSKSVGVRNALQLMLKDLQKEAGNTLGAIGLIDSVVQENDRMLSVREGK